MSTVRSGFPLRVISARIRIRIVIEFSRALSTKRLDSSRDAPRHSILSAFSRHASLSWDKFGPTFNQFGRAVELEFSHTICALVFSLSQLRLHVRSLLGALVCGGFVLVLCGTVVVR